MAVRAVACFASDPSIGPEIEGVHPTPDQFLHKLERWSIIDRYSAQFHKVEVEVKPGVLKELKPAASRERSVRVVLPETPEPILRYRLALKNPVHPVRNYRAPILEHRAELSRVAAEELLGTPQERAAAEVVGKSLALDGLLSTLAQALEILGPSSFATHGQAGLDALGRLGLPVDLLRYFPLEGSTGADPADIVSQIAHRLAQGKTAAELKPELQANRFAFVPSSEGFKIAEETGSSAIGLVRLQMGGGYDGGIIRGGTIDIAAQLMRALPTATFVASVEDTYFQNILWLATNYWGLRRSGSLTLIREQGPVRAWAQDNGKAGVLQLPGRARDYATLVPRYASQDEVNSPLIGGESFLMDGLHAAGYRVCQSPLLFQGGNLLAARDPLSGQHLLLVSEIELFRNVALGLAWVQALEAFRREFGVDKCVAVAPASFHLDLDVSIRVHHGHMLAFVNDAPAAARLIVARGVQALEAGGILSADDAQQASAFVHDASTAKLLDLVRKACLPYLDEHQQYRPALIRLFGSDLPDSPVFNFRCFLAALDLLASEIPPDSSSAPGSVRNQYLAALRELTGATAEQRKQLETLGCETVPVPSLPDLHHSINYLNGLQDQARYLMPVMGGFYSALDDAAAQAFQRALGPEVSIVRITAGEAQREHGGVHCVAAAYPKL